LGKRAIDIYKMLQQKPEVLGKNYTIVDETWVFQYDSEKKR
jgi:hypothetical protein